MDADNPYLLLTPGPLTTSAAVRQSMLRDYCTWDDDYHVIVSDIRNRLVRLAVGGKSGNQAVPGTDAFTSVLMQGSGTFAIEATLGTVIPHTGKVLIVDNGAYGRRIAQIVRRLKIAHVVLEQSEVEPADTQRMAAILASDPAITHVAMVHCETTTGLLNPAERVGEIANRYGVTYILDAMSSFGGIEMTMAGTGASYLVASSNKCIQGVPGFGFVIAERADFENTEGYARSLSLDLFDQWKTMENRRGKWRYTSPTHVVRAFATALSELDDEGGIPARAARYSENQTRLVRGMRDLGFRTLVPKEHQSSIITSFHFPRDKQFKFQSFYENLKRRGFVIYPGKVSHAETFRIGNIGQVFPSDIDRLLVAIKASIEELGLSTRAA